MIRRLVVALVGLTGCVYYNGMYSANQFANSARRAERDGKRFEAANFWAQAQSKADSVIAQHPDSKWATHAKLVRAEALERTGGCAVALGELERLLPALAEVELVERASLSVARCRLAQGDPAGAAYALAGVVESRDEDRRAEARLQMGRARRVENRTDDAIDVLSSVRDPRARRERLLALAVAGRVAETGSLADSLLDQGDTLVVWDSIFTALAASDPAAASTLVDTVVAESHADPVVASRWLIADGLRLEAREPARGAQRLHAVVEHTLYRSAPNAAQIRITQDLGAARVELRRRELRRAASLDELGPIIDSLEGLAKEDGDHAAAATEFRRRVIAFRTNVDSITATTPQGDMRLFLAGEAARDQLEAPALGAAIFRRVAELFPDSPYAPKAVLAARHLDPAWASASDTLLAGRYAASPYLAVLQGRDDPRYRALEDSLGAFALRAPVNTPVQSERARERARRLEEEERERAQPKQRPAPKPQGTRSVEP